MHVYMRGCAQPRTSGCTRAIGVDAPASVGKYMLLNLFNAGVLHITSGQMAEMALLILACLLRMTLLARCRAVVLAPVQHGTCDAVSRYV